MLSEKSNNYRHVKDALKWDVKKFPPRKTAHCKTLNLTKCFGLVSTVNIFVHRKYNNINIRTTFQPEIGAFLNSIIP